MNQKVAPLNHKLITLRQLLETRKQSLAAVIPKHMTPERLIKISLVAASRNPSLLNCSPDSIFTALMESSQLGLEPFTGMNYSYIIPYKNNKTGQTEAKFIPSYRGLIELARRSGQIKSIDADIIYERDEWEIEKGLHPILMHKPNFSAKDRGRPLLVYAVAIFKDGGSQFNVMTIEQIERIRKSSKSANQGPWVDWYESMCLKTCLKQMLRLCPMSSELAVVIAKDNLAEHGNDLNVDFVDPDEHLEIEEKHVASNTDDLVEKLSGVQTKTD